MFTCEFCEICRTPIVKEHLWTAASENTHSVYCNECTVFSNKESTIAFAWVNASLDVSNTAYDILDIKSSTTESTAKHMMIRVQLEFEKCHLKWCDQVEQYANS